MKDRAFDALARHAGTSQGRRTSLKVLGAATLATALAPALAAEAGKAGKKAKKKCKKQVGQCKSKVEEFCNEDAECLSALLPCCDPYKKCKAGEGTECWLQIID